MIIAMALRHLRWTGGKTTIFVANLCPRMDEASVKQVFSLDGKLEVVDVGLGS